jgi:RecB family exonuclease
LLQTLRSWELPIGPIGRPVDLDREPAVSALRMAMRLPIDGWDAAELIRLLRHGRLRPAWEASREPEAFAAAAALVRASGVFRGRVALRDALDRLVAEENGFAGVYVQDLVGRLMAEIEALDRPRSWTGHMSAVRRLAEDFGIDTDGDTALERLWAALDDQMAVMEATAGKDDVIAFSEFFEAVERLVGGLYERPEVITPGVVCCTTVEGAAGARGRFVILANLVEGSFPTRESVENADPEARAYGGEMARFLRVLGSADRGVILVRPTRDEKGQELLASGFLDELKRRIAPEAFNSVCVELNRIDPALVAHPELARSPADARARAVALACVKHDRGALARLAGDPRHRPVLAGSAAALTLSAWRRYGRDFSTYEGRLAGPDVPGALAARFGRNAAFSPSQLESYLFCPFQFFVKYVLGLLPVDERDEAEEDFIRRGNRLHKLLETLETLRRRDGGELLELCRIVVRTEMSVELTVTSEADAGLHAIERRRVEQTLGRYVAQSVEYERSTGDPRPQPHLLETRFGDPRQPDGFPVLEIGAGPDAVRVRGTIDRVDVVESEAGTAFRVIDYKTGSPPSKSEVVANRMVQLPLYALAVERLGLAGEAARLLDVGYWDLREKGFRAIELKDWPEAQTRLEGAVLDAVARLRAGRFEVDPRSDGCQSTCDYAGVCRIGEARSTRRAREGRPR